MSISNTALAAAAAISFAFPAFADGIEIGDPYARAAMPMAKSGAAFMTLRNLGDSDDRLIAATTDAAARAELHTHVEEAGGIMRMVEVEDGFAVPAGGSHQLARGGDHVMLFGLTRPLLHGDSITMTLRFERAGDIVVEIPVDLERDPMTGPAMGGGAGG